jgi:homoserine dehydrogenase
MRIVLGGFGVVAQSLCRLLLSKERELNLSFGMVPRVVGIIDSESCLQDDRGVDLNSAIRTKAKTGKVGRPSGRRRTADIIREVDGDVLVESTPTNFRTGEPGLAHIKAAFQSKKSVIATNKGPMAVAFRALVELAHHNGVYFRFSGAVGGGTPILDFGRSCARGDTITGIMGILNSTSNYVLTRMEKDGRGFDEAVRLAQAEGYAEADPSLDVDGFDSAVKLVIMANFLLAKNASMGDVRVTGIRDVTQERLREARRRGMGIRLVARVDRALSVAPVELQASDPLCISGPFNAVKFICENSGDKIIVGKGAGGIETASSVLRDLIEIRGLLGARAG